MSDDEPRARRVLFLADVVRGSHGGTEGQMHALATALPKTWECCLWVLRPSEHLERGGFPGPTRCLGIGSLTRPWTPWRVRRLAREVRRERFDLIQTFLADASVLGPLIGARAGVPVLVSRRDLGFWQTPKFRSVLRRTDRLAAGFLANCEAVKARIVEVEHVHPATVHVVHNGHASEVFDAPADEGLRERLGIPPAAPIVALLANWKPLKRSQDLVAALGILKTKATNAHALLVGHDYDEAAVREWCQRAGVEGRVHVVPTRGPVVPMLRNAAVGVLCSDQEGLSNAVIEYLGCGLPVVATSVGGNPEMVREGENGFLYAPGDVDALAAALGRLLADPAFAAAYGRASRRRFEEDFLVERMATETAAVYERLVEPAGDASRELSWETLTDVGALEALAEPWGRLLGPSQFFLGPDWVLSWLRWRGSEALPHVLVARDSAGSLAGLLPLARTRRRVLETCGSSRGAVHLDVVAARGLARAVAEGALAALECGRFRHVRLSHLAEDGALRLAIRARRWAIPFTERHSTSCPYLEARGTFDRLLRDRFPTKYKMMRYRVRRAVGPKGEHLRRIEDPAQCPAAIDTLFDLHARRFESLAKRSTFTGERLRDFHKALATDLAKEGRLALTILSDGERPIAAQYAIRSGRTMHLFQTGFDPEAAKLSPNQVLLMVSLEQDVFGTGLAEFDFLSGEQDYKMSWSTGTRRLFDVDLFRPTRMGRASCLVHGAVRTLRSRVGAALRRRRELPT